MIAEPRPDEMPACPLLAQSGHELPHESAEVRFFQERTFAYFGGHVRPSVTTSDINLFGYGQSIVHLDAEVPYGTFDLCVSE